MRSKHYGQRRLIDEDGKPVHGKCRVLPNSSLRKIMRAARQSKIPDDRQVMIDTAADRATARRAAYLNSSPLKSAYVSRRNAAAKAKRAAERAARAA